MGLGAFLEPLVIVSLLFGGAWINRAPYSPSGRRVSDYKIPMRREVQRQKDEVAAEPASESVASARYRSLSPSLLPSQEEAWRSRRISCLGYTAAITTPNTAVFRNRRLSRLLCRFPFLVEVWYWALIYWVYQVGRALSALTLVEGTVVVARRHALQLIEWEEYLHIFWEPQIQHFFMQYPRLMTYINWLYSFIHIPGTILFLVCLYYYTITSNRLVMRKDGSIEGRPLGSPSGPALYEARRRTMAVCNLIAFVIFTLWPCMPPRLLSDPTAEAPLGDVARSYGFVDTVHSDTGASSVWTQNKFCNQYAAMPSLHFGYSLLVGVTVMTIPLASGDENRFELPPPMLPHLASSSRLHFSLPSKGRLLCVLLGFLYPASILTAIVATANHFILDAVAGAAVCFLGWKGNRLLLNLLPIEDYFLWCLRIHKPTQEPVSVHAVKATAVGQEKAQTGVLECA